MGFKLLVVILFIISGASKTNSGQWCRTAGVERYQTDCYFWGWQDCTAYRKTYPQVCCTGWTGVDCETSLTTTTEQPVVHVNVKRGLSTWEIVGIIFAIIGVIAAIIFGIHQMLN